LHEARKSVSYARLHQPLVVHHALGLAHAQLPVQHVQKLALNPSYIALLEDAGAERPVDVLERGVIGVLGGDDEGAEEDALEGDTEVGAGTGDVH
jgi:hypothetical protein